MFLEDEALLTKELKQLCFANGKETDPRKSAHLLHKLGLLYKDKSPDKQSLVQSVALVTSALIRKPDNSLEITNDLNDICEHILDLAQSKNKSFSLKDASANLKQQIEILRKETQTKLSSIGAIPDDAESEVRQELESKKIKEVSELQAFVVEKYMEIVRWASNHCESIMGAAPCQYALVGLGSLARKEVTPYSDFECTILLEEGVQFLDHYDRVLEYFRWFSTIFQVMFIQLGETPLRFLSIPCFKSELNPEQNWFDDCLTPCGLSCKWLTSVAGNNLFDCQTATSVKPRKTGLIRPVSEMLRYLDFDDDSKEEYHLTDSLLKTCFVAGHPETYKNFSQAVHEKLTWLVINQRSSVLGRTLNQVLDIFTWNNGIKLNPASTEHPDVTRSLNRGPALFVVSLGRLYALKEPSCLEILQKIYIMEKITENEWNAFKLSLTLAYEMRLCFDALFQSKCFLKSQNNFALSDNKHDKNISRSVETRPQTACIKSAKNLEETLQKSISKGPTQCYYHLLHEKAACLFSLGKNDEAEQVLGHLIECRKIVTIHGCFNPWATTCLYELAKHIIAQGNFQAALDTCEKAWEHEYRKEINKFVYLKVKSDCLLGLKRIHEAHSLLTERLELLEQYATTEENVKKPVLDLRTEKRICFKELIDCSLSLKAYEEAVTYCEQSLDLINQSSHPKSLKGISQDELLSKLVFAMEKSGSIESSDWTNPNSVMAHQLSHLDAPKEPLKQSRKNWQEILPLGWSGPSTKRKLEVLSSLVVHLHYNTRWKENLQATEYAVSIAQQFYDDPCGESVTSLLQVYLVCLLAVIPDCKTIPYMFTPSIYYHALLTIPAVQSLPNVWEWMWADIRERLLKEQHYLNTSKLEKLSISTSDVQRLEDENTYEKDSKKKIGHQSSEETIAKTCPDGKDSVDESSNVMDDMETLNAWFLREKTATVGSAGAVIKVGGCRVSIPKGALDDNVEVTLTSSYQEDFPANPATPLLTCEPHGLKFNKDVEIALPTCYLTDGTFSVLAEARRSEDGNLWETVKTFDYTVERCFKFCIRGFSLYEVIIERISDLTVEKEVVCCIPHKYSHDPQKVALICNIFDAIGEHRKHNCTDVMTTSLLVGNSESSVSFQLTSEEININQTIREVDFVRSSKIKQARFVLTKRDENMTFKPLKLVITAGETTTEEDFFIYCDEPSDVEENKTSAKALPNPSESSATSNN